MRILNVYRNLVADERKFAMRSAVSFGLILCSYTALRPIRDELGIAKGVESLHWSFLLTLIGMTAAVPLFGWLSSTIYKERLIPAVFLFFVSNLLVFSFLLKFYPNEVAPVFFSWVSIFNLTTISLFWTVLSDMCSESRAKVLFGPIAAGGSIGAFLGPVLTSQFIRIINAQGILIVSASLLLLAVILIGRIPTLKVDTQKRLETKVGGGVLTGLACILKSPFMLSMATLTFVGNILGTILYFRQADLLSAQIQDPISRTEILSYIDLSVNSLSLIFQFFLTPLCLSTLSPKYAFSIIPIVISLCFVGLGFSSALEILILAQIFRRATIYALAKPVESLLFSVRSDEEAYKGRNVIDTFVYRLGDSSGATILGILFGGVASSGVMFGGAGVSLGLIWITYSLGNSHEKQSQPF